MRRYYLSFSVLLCSLASAPVASAQEAEAEAADAPPSASPYILSVRNGIRLAMARDYDGALAALRGAIQENPSRPHAYYYAGEVHRMNNDLDGALRQFRQGAQIAEQAQDDMLWSRCLKAVAETIERKEGALQQAREAWQQYARFADSHRTVANPEIARARIQAINQVIEQEAAYVAVRQRIAARERENAGGNRQRRRGD
jgi:tetratricopeptide (TPR) repeat protein